MKYTSKRAKMIKVFIPQIKGRVKTSVRGFWYSQDTKKIYYDYLRLSNRFNLIAELEAIKTRYNQEAIAYIEDKVLKIFHNENKIEVLDKSIFKEVLRQDLKRSIKEALRLYGGVTAYIKKGKYYLESFYK